MVTCSNCGDTITDPFQVPILGAQRVSKGGRRNRKFYCSECQD